MLMLWLGLFDRWVVFSRVLAGQHLICVHACGGHLFYADREHTYALL
jgi:hypothetical protein